MIMALKIMTPSAISVLTNLLPLYLYFKLYFYYNMSNLFYIYKII